jgi:hypothetical protein
MKKYSCDFESFYTNINYDQALNVICDFISQNFHSNEINILGFRKLLEIIFNFNFLIISSINDKVFKQIHLFFQLPFNFNYINVDKFFQNFIANSELSSLNYLKDINLKLVNNVKIVKNES